VVLFFFFLFGTVT